MYLGANDLGCHLSLWQSMYNSDSEEADAVHGRISAHL